MKKTLLFMIVSLIPAFCLSQNLPKDTLLGNVKRLREKVVFLTKVENPQMLYYKDYGHSGFSGPESTISHFHNIWYSGKYCYYINYERHFDEQKNVSNETWFGKKDDFIRSYRYVYDEKNRLISKVDSSEFAVDITNHYFNESGGFKYENVIQENLGYNGFSYYHNTHKYGKIILSKNIDEDGKVHEYTMNYNEKGNLLYQTYKVPHLWKKVYNNSESSSTQDSINITFKNFINEYDADGRILKTQMFSLSSEEPYKPIKYYEKSFTYSNGNLTMTSEDHGEYKHYKKYKYDELNRIIAEYRGTKDISKPGIVLKYTYKDGRIATLDYFEAASFDKAQKHKISYTYKFDANNNWTEIIKIVDGKKLYKWIREIEYY